MDKNFAHPNIETDSLWNVGFETIKELEMDNGILASGREEIFGCIFGRDSLITSLKLLKVYEQTEDPYFLSLVKKIINNLALLQGKEINIESGEEPGKCIHEYRQNNHEHLTKKLDMPWYVYPDATMRNYDSVDSTPLFLIACYRYLQASNDTGFIEEVLPNIKSALVWIKEYSDRNNDGLVDYGFNQDRKFGGLTTQSWMDSAESVFHEDGTTVAHPIAPVEAQSYTFLALRLWSEYFRAQDAFYAEELYAQASRLKQLFNAMFVTEDKYGMILAAGIDGAGKLMMSARSSMGHCLWASLEYEKDGISESIVADEYIPHIVKRLMMSDLFESKAGIRTLSMHSSHYASNSYHNGSIWPHDTSMIAEGFEIFGFHSEAQTIRGALLHALLHFNTPIELFVYDGDAYGEYRSSHGQEACKKQAWSAASLLKDVGRIKNPKIVLPYQS
jgi:glycogen debranching enzyme